MCHFYTSRVDYGPIYFSLLSFSMVADKYQIVKDQLLSCEYIFFESLFHLDLTCVNRPKNFGQALKIKRHTHWYFLATLVALHFTPVSESLSRWALL